MAWTASGMFTVTMADLLVGTIANTTFDLDASSAFKVALYDNDITPNYEVAASAAMYGAGGIWTATGDQTGTSGSQIYHTGQWAQGGVVLATTAVTRPGSGVVMWDSSGDPASGSAATMSNIYGGLIYCDALTTPVVDQAILAVYFGGTGYSVTNGTFTIQWNGSGIFRLTIA
jgi:hypothetical protein